MSAECKPRTSEEIESSIKHYWANDQNFANILLTTFKLFYLEL